MEDGFILLEFGDKSLEVLEMPCTYVEEEFLSLKANDWRVDN